MLDFLILFLIFIFGLLVGSFLNSVIYRLEKDQSFLRGRSFCPYCKHILSWRDLIPVFSFFLLKGRCRYCRQKISWQYPAVEISTAAIFLLIFNVQFSIFNQFTIYNFLNIIYYWIISSFLIVIFVYDLKHYIIPDKIIYPAIGTAFTHQLFGVWSFGHWNLFRISDLGFGILPSLFFLGIILFSQGKWMGLGDFKLAILMGLFLGFPNVLIALFLAFFFGAIIGIGLITSGKKTLKSEVPFGPFLITAAFISLFWGDKVINWYFNLI